MSKIIFLFLFFTFIITKTCSQIYIKADIGYGLLPISELKQYNSYTDSLFISIESFGSGFYYSLGFGYKITKNISIELDGSLLKGLRYKYNFAAGSSEKYSKSIFLIPSAKLHTTINNLIPYFRFGLLIGKPVIYEEHFRYKFSGICKYIETGPATIGIMSGLGIDFKLGKQLSIYAELYGQLLNWKPNEKENTETYNGATITPLIKYNDSSAPIYSFDSFGVKIGFGYYF